MRKCLVQILTRACLQHNAISCNSFLTVEVGTSRGRDTAKLAALKRHRRAFHSSGPLFGPSPKLTDSVRSRVRALARGMLHMYQPLKTPETMKVSLPPTALPSEVPQHWQ